MQSQLDKFVTKLKSLLEARASSKSVQKKLENPEELAEHLVKDIGSDTQRISLKP